LTIVESLELHQTAKREAILLLRNAFPRKFPGFKIIPTTETEIKSIIHFLKVKKILLDVME
jgi:hypothetical protein